MINLKSSLIAKGTLGLLGISGLGVGGYYTHKALNNQKVDITDKLKNDGYELLTTNSQHFEAILTSYKSVIAKKPELKIGDFNGEKTITEEAKDILLRHCASIIKNGGANNNYKKASKWCVEPISIATILDKQKVTILKTGDDYGKDVVYWTSKIQNLKDSDNNTPKFTGIVWTNEGDNIDDKDYPIIRNKCQEVGNIVNHKEEFEDSLERFKSWCTNS